MGFEEDRREFFELRARNYDLWWSWEATPTSFRRYIYAVRASYMRWAKYFETIEPLRAREYREIVRAIEERVIPTLERFQRRWGRLFVVITEENILRFKEELLDIKKGELRVVERFSDYLIAGFPEREMFIYRLEDFDSRLREVIERIERLIDREKRLWTRLVWVLGTYDPSIRNIELHFHAPYYKKWAFRIVEDRVKEVMRYFLRLVEYDIPVWDFRNFGWDYEEGEKWYFESEVSNRFSLILHDYDYGAIRARADFNFDIHWIDKIEELKETIRRNIVITRGKRTGRPRKW
jgi:hypothetical protein